jgi:hypothetical protein
MNFKAARRLIGLGLLSLTALPLRAHACQTPVTDVQVGVLAAWLSDLPEIPRNVAFVWWAGSGHNGAVPTEPVRVAVDSASQPIMGRVLKGIGSKTGKFIAKPDEPLSPRFEIQSGGHQFTTGDYLDEAAPAVPQVTAGRVHYDDNDGGGCESVSSCAGLTSLIVTLAEPAKDDRAPRAAVAYAIYLEKSADAARTTPTPFALVSEMGAVNDPSLVVTLDASWADSDAFVSVAAIDWAANESPRTEPQQVNSSGSGCALRLPRSHRSTFAIALAMVTGLAWVRRRTRRR